LDSDCGKAQELELGQPSKMKILPLPEWVSGLRWRPDSKEEL